MFIHFLFYNNTQTTQAIQPYINHILAKECRCSFCFFCVTTASSAEVQAEPLVKMGNLTRLLLLSGGFLGTEDYLRHGSFGGSVAMTDLSSIDLTGQTENVKLSLKVVKYEFTCYQILIWL